MEEERMTDTLLTCNTSPFSTAPLAAGSHRLTTEAGGHAGKSGLALHRESIRSPATCPASELPIADVHRDSAEYGIPGRLLFIGEGRALPPDNLRRAFPASAHRVHIAGSAQAGLERVGMDSPDVIVLDLGLADRSGLEVYQEVRRRHARLPIIVLVAAGLGDAAIELIKQGAYDCLFKPLDMALLRRVVAQALHVARRMRQCAVSEETGTDLNAGSGLIGSCPAMQEVYKAIGRVADQDVPVLITGESGTGKELVARALYHHSARAPKPFLALNCAAIPETLLESELFGHEKGAFTGAERRRIGKFEQCNGGTLFLDEIGDMPLPAQAKLLRVLQEQVFQRVGGTETVRTDVRLIAATHRDLKAWSDEGKFRLDLYYRLGVFAIDLPPLRERGEDLPLLVQFYLRRGSRELGREVREVAPEALARLRGYAWPGNVRELQSVLKQSLLRAHGPVLLPEFLPELPEAPGKPAAPVASPGGCFDPEAFLRRRLGPDSRDLYAEIHRELDRLVLPRVLEHTGGNQARAAVLLGIARRTLHTKLGELGLQVTRTIGADEAEPL
jgi:two-component system nitrogen regulation response regulator GlnG